jgi:hypothetical protein
MELPTLSYERERDEVAEQREACLLNDTSALLLWKVLWYTKILVAKDRVYTQSPSIRLGSVKWLEAMWPPNPLRLSRF